MYKSEDPGRSSALNTEAMFSDETISKLKSITKAATRPASSHFLSNWAYCVP